MTEVAKILKWVVLAAIIGLIATELLGYMSAGVMGLILVPLVFAFMYFWQAASKKS